MEKELSTLSIRIKELRQEKGLTQAEFSALLGKKESTARMWEIGRSNPEYSTLIDIAKFFNVTTDYLLGLTEFRTNTDASEMSSRFDEFIDNKSRFDLYESEMVFDINKYLLSSIDFYRDDTEFCLSFLSLMKELAVNIYDISAQIYLSTLEKGKFENYAESQIKKYVSLVLARLGLMEKAADDTVEKIVSLFTYRLNENIPAKYMPKSVEVELEELHKLFKEHLGGN
ncbi:helix-turn-helix transcriptional regulator [Tyzzerella sp. OttesenSCG-928-J15]|nr:helix-turn-helix transcriptional regulator [Tyzzerella sp. OttesenSCG-928-J15]